MSYWTEHDNAVKIIAFAGSVCLLQDHLSQLLSGPRFLAHLVLVVARPAGSIAMWDATVMANGNLASGQRRTISRAAIAKTNLSSLRPIDLTLAADGWCVRVFHLEPLVRAASAVQRAKPLADDALTAERASMLVDQRAVAVIGRVERDPVVPFAQCPSKMLLAFLDAGFLNRLLLSSDSTGA